MTLSTCIHLDMLRPPESNASAYDMNLLRVSPLVKRSRLHASLHDPHGYLHLSTRT